MYTEIVSAIGKIMKVESTNPVPRYKPAKKADKVVVPPKLPVPKEVKGPYIPIPVVAAKLQKRWIIRGWCPFQTVEAIVKEMLPYVLDGGDDLEWTTYTYEAPAYLIYGSRWDDGDLKGWGWPVGIYKFPYRSYDDYRGEIECLREGFVQGSWATR